MFGSFGKLQHYKKQANMYFKCFVGRIMSKRSSTGSGTYTTQVDLHLEVLTGIVYCSLLVLLVKHNIRLVYHMWKSSEDWRGTEIRYNL